MGCYATYKCFHSHLHTYLMLRYTCCHLHLREIYLILGYRRFHLHLHTYLMLRYRYAVAWSRNMQIQWLRSRYSYSKNNRDTQNAKKKINTCVLLQRNTNTFKFGHPKKQSFVKQTEDGTEAKTRFSQKHSGIAKERNTQTIKNATACGLCTWRKHQHWHFFWNAGPKLGLFGCFCSAGWELVKDCSSSAPFRIFQGLSSWTMETAKSRALALHDGMSTWNLVSLDEFLCALYETICLTYFVAKLEVQLLAAHMNPCRVGLQCQVRRGGNNRCQISMETDWCSFCQKSCYNHYRHAWPHRL